MPTLTMLRNRGRLPREPITPTDLKRRGDSRAQVTIGQQVEPDRHRYRWTVSYHIGNGPPNPGMYRELNSKRWPKPQTVSGTSRTEWQAWVEARRTVNLLQTQVASAHNHLNRIHNETVNA